MHTEQRQKNKVKKVRSIGTRMTIIFSAVLIVALAACWVANIFFLQDYYIKNKLMAIKEAYEYMDEASKADNLSGEKFLAGLRTICETDNISLFVMDQNGRARLTSVHDSEELQRDLYEYVLGIRPNQKSILAENDQYLMSVNRDSPNGGYLKMAGVLSGGEPFIIRTAVEPIRESVSLANRFLIYVGSIVLLVGAFIIHWVSKRISEPILELARLSERMSDLDFDVKFEGGRDSEIIFLGNHMNQLSETLEKTISELKTANNELQRDIEQKEKRDEMRKEFLSNVSHELKTPIALVQGYAEGLKECINDDPESREFYCDVIMDEAGKMNKLVKNLLTLNELEFGNEVVTMERFDLASMIHNMLRSMQVLFEQKRGQRHGDDRGRGGQNGAEAHAEQAVGSENGHHGETETGAGEGHEQVLATADVPGQSLAGDDEDQAHGQRANNEAHEADFEGRQRQRAGNDARRSEHHDGRNEAQKVLHRCDLRAHGKPLLLGAGRGARRLSAPPPSF